MEPLEGPEMMEADQAVMQRYFTDPNLFVMENERLDEAIIHLRRRYDAEVECLKPAIADLLKDRTNAFATTNLPELLPRFLIRISNAAQTSLSLGLNFLRSTVDAITDHVQHKVAHFHHALLVLGGLLDEHLRRFQARLNGLNARVKGIEAALGISATEATVLSSARDATETTLIQRVATLEATVQTLKSEILLLKLMRMRVDTREDTAGARAASPSCRSASSVTSHKSRHSLASRASTYNEARCNLHHAKKFGSPRAMISAAQEVARFRLPDGSFGSETQA